VSPYAPLITYSPSFGGDPQTRPPAAFGRYKVRARIKGTQHLVGTVTRRKGRGLRGGERIRWLPRCAREQVCAWDPAASRRRHMAADMLVRHYAREHLELEL
jgi:hypothetical protein